MMRNAPMRWIEQAERRDVMTHALFAPTPRVPWSGAAAESARQWLPRLGAWLADRMGAPMPCLQLEPVPVSRPVRPAAHHSRGW